MAVTPAENTVYPVHKFVHTEDSIIVQKYAWQIHLFSDHGMFTNGNFL